MVKRKSAISIAIAMFLILAVGLCLIQTDQASAGSKGTKAATWAIKKANNNKWKYGYSGDCPICTKKGKTFACAGFVTAAYAHGAKDKEARKWCDRAETSVVGSLMDHMYYSKNWRYMGYVKPSKLKRGDVLFYGYEHVEMYAGSKRRVQKIVGAHGEGKDSISVRNLRDHKYYTDVFRHK